jgi:preprotein translocase subunit SecB
MEDLALAGWLEEQPIPALHARAVTIVLHRFCLSLLFPYATSCITLDAVRSYYQRL